MHLDKDVIKLILSKVDLSLISREGLITLLTESYNPELLFDIIFGEYKFPEVIEQKQGVMEDKPERRYKLHFVKIQHLSQEVQYYFEGKGQKHYRWARLADWQNPEYLHEIWY